MADRSPHGQRKRVRCLSRSRYQNEYGIIRKIITTRNPQANSIIERIHQVVGDMIRTRAIFGRKDLPDDGSWQGVLSARQAVRSIVHTTTRATPTQLVFGRDALLNIAFVADLHYIKERKMRRIIQNNQRENATRWENPYQPAGWRPGNGKGGLQQEVWRPASHGTLHGIPGTRQRNPHAL